MPFSSQRVGKKARKYLLLFAGLNLLFALKWIICGIIDLVSGSIEIFPVIFAAASDRKEGDLLEAA